MYAECPPGQKSSRCGEVAALVEVRLYTFTSLLMDTLLKPTAIVVTCFSFSFWLTFSKRHGHIERNVRLIESQIKGRTSNERQGPNLGVPFTEVWVL